MTDDHNHRLSYQDAVSVLQHLAEGFHQTTGRQLTSIVAFGGTALAAHKIRDRSEDIDVFVSEVDDAVLDRTVTTFRPRFGLGFKIDATPSNTLWGAIAVADITESPVVGQLRVAGDTLAVRALSVETMYLVKTAADRPKDQPDIVLLSKKTSYEKLLERARQAFPWYADRGAFPSHIERLARYISRDFRTPLKQVDKDFQQPEVVVEKVKAIREGLLLQFSHTLKGLMSASPHLITFDPKTPHVLRFDAKSAGAGDEVLDMMLANRQSVSDIAAIVLKERTPHRHIDRLRAIKNVNSPGR